MALPTPKVTKSLRELSCVINGGTATRVLEILRRNMKELGDEQYRLSEQYIGKLPTTKKDVADYTKRSKELTESIEQLSRFIQMFEDIRWSQDTLQPAFYRRILNGTKIEACNDRH